MMKNYYETLSILPNATEKEIKDAYKQLALKTHPDKAQGKEDEFKEIVEAYECLKNPALREQYNQSINLPTSNKRHTEPKQYFFNLDKITAESSGVSKKTWKKYSLRSWERSEERLYYYPFFEFRKNIFSTFKPYKSNYYIIKDIILPLYSLLHLSISLLCFIGFLAWPFTAIFALIMKQITPHVWSDFTELLIPVFEKMVSPKYLGKSFLAAIGFALLGTAELFFIPLNYLIRMLFRWLITPKDRSMRLSAGVQRTVKEFDKALEEENLGGIYVTFTVLEKKLKKAHRRCSNKKILEEENGKMAKEIGELLKKGNILWFEKVPMRDNFKQMLHTYINFFKLKSDTADIDGQDDPCFKI